MATTELPGGANPRQLRTDRHPAAPEPAPAARTAHHRLARALPDAAAAAASGHRVGLAAGESPETPPPETSPPETPPPDERAPDPRAGVITRLGGAAFDPGRPGVRVLAVVATVVVLAAAALAWWSRPQPEPVPPLPAASTPGGSSPAAAPAAAPAEPTELVVAVTGEVHRPGLVRLPPGARVADAVEAAGGPLPEADLDYLNLARKLSDGELIAVGIPPPPDQPVTEGGAAGRKVNLNMAGQAELETLPGVGPALAQRILDHRATNGPFESVSQLRQVSGIGEVRLAELRDRVTV